MTITEQELRECPFCGDKPVFNTYQDESNFSHNIVTFYQIYCGCMPNPDFSIENKEEAINEWNTRAYDAELEELRKLKHEVIGKLNFMRHVKNEDKHDYYRIDLIISWIEELLK